MKCLKERQSQLKDENEVIKLENGITPKLEAMEERGLFSGMDTPQLSPLRPPQSVRKRRFENDLQTGASPLKSGASHERLVKPRLDTN